MVALKLLRDICWRWHLRLFMKGRNRKRWKGVTVIEIPASGSNWVHLQRRRCTSRLYLELASRVTILATEPKTESHLCQAKNWRVNCPTLSHQGTLVLKVPPPQKNLLDLLHLATNNWCCHGSQQNFWDSHQWSWGDSPGNRQVSAILMDFGVIWSILPVYSGTHPSHIFVTADAG